MTSALGDAQLHLIEEVRDALAARKIQWWLFGGWGLDARLGKVMREHGDIEFWVHRSDGDRVRDTLVAIGLTVLDTQPPDEAREFAREDVIVSSGFFHALADGGFGAEGRWSDWLFPAGSFSAPPGKLGALVVPAMSAGGMLAMKEQYANLRNGGPPRPKDVRDLEVLRDLVRGSV